MHLPEHVREAYLKKGKGHVVGNLSLKAQTLAFFDFPKPSIVAVNGVAVGGGANVALMFHDFCICSGAFGA